MKNHRHLRRTWEESEDYPKFANPTRGIFIGQKSLKISTSCKITTIRIWQRCDQVQKKMQQLPKTNSLARNMEHA